MKIIKDYKQTKKLLLGPFVLNAVIGEIKPFVTSVQEILSPLLEMERRINMSECKWCQNDSNSIGLICNRFNTAFGEIDGELGLMAVTIFSAENYGLKGYGKINFCPICGRLIGNRPHVRFLRELRKVFGEEVSFNNMIKYAGSNAWIRCKEKIPELSNMNDKQVINFCLKNRRF